MCVVGARPNFMKIKPVIDALERRSAKTTLVHTGQHYDEGMSDVFFTELGLRKPDIHLEVGSASPARQTGAAMELLEPVIEEAAPDVVVVVGDVNSTLAAALVTAKSPARLAHVEAGLRSGDWSMPEEINRVVTDRLSDYLLAPSPDGVDNLLAEGIDEEKICLAGNVMVDTLLANIDRAKRSKPWERFGMDQGHYGLVTLHRPANVDDPKILEGLAAALSELSERLRLIFPVHPRTQAVLSHIGLAETVIVCEPLGYLDFIGLESGAALVLTDSGGVQEETTMLEIPCLTLRENTERPLTVTEGTNRVIGRDPTRIVGAAHAVLEDPPEARNPELWDGHAADRIADFLLRSEDLG